MYPVGYNYLYITDYQNYNNWWSLFKHKKGRTHNRYRY